MNELYMGQGEMISMLDGAAGRLLVASMKDNVIREAMEMITKVSLALGEVEEMTFAEYSEDDDDE